MTLLLLAVTGICPLAAINSRLDAGGGPHRDGTGAPERGRARNPPVPGVQADCPALTTLMMAESVSQPAGQAGRARSRASYRTGWADVCLDPTLSMYRRLRNAGRRVRLVVGPWNHTSGFSEALGWLRAYLRGDDSGLPAQPVRVWVGAIGSPGRWRDLPDWPPPDVRAEQWHLDGDGTLTISPAAGETVSSVRYDPAHPTPSVGGPSMDSRTAKPQRNNALEARDDVLVFTCEPLRAAVEVIGPVSISLRVRGSGPHFDVFARLCDVDPRGRSWNVCDGLVRVRDGNGYEVRCIASALDALGPNGWDTDCLPR